MDASQIQEQLLNTTKEMLHYADVASRMPHSDARKTLELQVDRDLLAITSLTRVKTIVCPNACDYGLYEVCPGHCCDMCQRYVDEVLN